jgi:signal transduction histidine kinase
MPGGLSVEFRALFEKCPGLYLALDAHLFIIAATDNYLHATLTQRENIVGQHLFDVLAESQDDHNATGVRNLRRSLERVLRERMPDSIAVQKYNIRHPNGEFEERFWSVANTPILDKTGGIGYIIHCIQDVTDFVHLKKSGDERSKLTDPQNATMGVMEREILSRSEELGAINHQLKVANEELALRTAHLNDALQTMETFTYSIAHDLRAPLRALVTFSTMLGEEYGETLQDQGKDYLHRIKEAAFRMDRLVGDLLVYGRLTHVEATSVPISLDQAVTKVLQDLGSTIRGRKAEVEVKRPLPTVMGSPVLVNHVLSNVIDNALKFMPPDRTPQIVVLSTFSDDRARLYITDNGIGIHPAYHAKIFDLFARLHKPSEYSGTGIGLALVKKAMERMMGKVGVESTLGSGSSFWLEFRSADDSHLKR